MRGRTVILAAGSVEEEVGGPAEGDGEEEGEGAAKSAPDHERVTVLCGVHVGHGPWHEHFVSLQMVRVRMMFGMRNPPLFSVFFRRKISF